MCSGYAFQLHTTYSGAADVNIEMQSNMVTKDSLESKNLKSPKVIIIVPHC